MTIKVGDELAFSCGYRGNYEIHKVEKITPSGRIRVGRWELDPDLRVRGKYRYSGPYRAELVTPEIRDAVERETLQMKIQTRSLGLAKLSLEKLRRIAAILEEA